MKDAFKALSAENSASFRSQSADSIAELLKPIREKFAEFDKSVQESQKESAAQSAAIRTHIEQVLQQSKSVGDEARNLANALTGYSKVQGDFGEMLLIDVLKNAGLVEGIHFFTQGVMTDESGHEIRSESGRTMIPDVMIYYPTKLRSSWIRKSACGLTTTTWSRKPWNRASVPRKAHVESVRKHG